MPGKSNVPTAYRAILREAKKGKRGRDVRQLMRDARDLPDPYFQALGLFTLSSDPRLPLRDARAAAEDAVERAGRVTPVWRQGEVLAEMARMTNRWRASAPEGGVRETRDAFHGMVAERVRLLPAGHGLSQAIQGVAPRLPARHLEGVLAHALANQGFEQDDARAVLRAWVRGVREDARGTSPDAVVERLNRVEDAALRSKLLGYVHLQAAKARVRLDGVDAFGGAVHAAQAVGDVHARVEALRYLVRVVASGEKDLKRLRAVVDGFVEPLPRARLLATLGGAADKLNLRDAARTWLQEGLAATADVPDALARAQTRTNLGEGLARADLTDAAAEAFTAAVADAAAVEDEAKRARALQKLRDAAARVRVDVDVPEDAPAPRAAPEAPAQAPAAAPATERAAPAATGNPVLALYDAYEGALKPAHHRAIARAAPLCYAFGFDLALVGFPTDDLDRIVREVMEETNIGRGGRFLGELVAEGRVLQLPGSADAPPRDWSRLGLPVATTSRPDKAKAVGMADALRAAAPGRVCLIMGLGRQGLPPALLKSVPHHLELTGQDVPLETATAMGIIAERLRATRDALRD